MVTWFNKSKGYGEIYGEDGETYFFTYEDIVSKNLFKTADKDQYFEFSPGELTRFGVLRATSMTAVETRKNKSSKRSKGLDV